MTYESALAKLRGCGQEHVLRYYEELNDAEKADLLTQIEETDFSVIENFYHPENLSGKGEIAPIEGLDLAAIEEKKAEYIAVGKETIKAGKVGAILLAGGQGTRLGSDHPKGTYNIGVTRELYIFECLVNNLLDVVKECGTVVPLYIMTSDKNHAETVAFFEEHNFFGYDSSFVKFFKQDMAPAVDQSGKVLLEAKGRIALSPNGNGGWFSSLVRAGLLEDVHARGVEWLNVFAVDNVCQRIADPAFVGASVLAKTDCGSKAVSKAEPHEKVGVLCLEEGHPSIVEYYELSEEMAQAREADGTLKYRYGVILNYLFSLDALERILSQKIPVHVVRKKVPYIDENGTLVKPETENGCKFETLVLDMIKLMNSCLPYEVVREYEFAPVKNKTGVDSVESARELLKKNGVEL
ncbi:MAG: UDPGP type 1 family protein [Clostridia bacterium]|nr:UDPGP type 1 family protein [Clostridia bacterium]